MLNNDRIREFFDEWSKVWDDRLQIDEGIMDTILDNAEVEEGKDILDIACGTGTLFPFYEKRKVRSLTGIDISPGMTKIAAGKGFAKVLTGDASTYPYGERYDVIMIYNAFPHIADRDLFLKHMEDSLKENGIFSIAHNMSYRQLIRHHDNVSEEVCSLMPDIDELEKLLLPYFEVTGKVSDEHMFQICGRKRK